MPERVDDQGEHREDGAPEDEVLGAVPEDGAPVAVKGFGDDP